MNYPKIMNTHKFGTLIECL